MMIVIVEVVGEVMVIIDIVDNQYTARRAVSYTHLTLPTILLV